MFIWVFFCVVILLFLLFLFSIMPSRPNSDETAKFTHLNYAHRGLYLKDQSIPENSLPAFQRACEHGYGMEMDIQLSKDGKVVVFHDDDLKRAAGIDARVDSFTYDELSKLPLFGTDNHIPLFEDVLAMVNGQAPLIVELKTGPNNTELCEKGYALLEHYNGLYCVESFDPRIMRWFKKNHPEIFRGQLACCKESANSALPSVVVSMAAHCMMNFLSRPNFIAYELVQKPFSVRLAEKLGAVRVCWTSRSPGNESVNDIVIFEHYLPETHF